MITAPRGLLGAPPGLYPTDVMHRWRALLPGLEVTELDDVNHYTMVMAAAGRRPDRPADRRSRDRV